MERSGNPRTTRLLAFSIHDPTFGQVIGREFDAHLVARNDTNEVLSHAAGYVSHDLGSGLELDAKPGICERLSYGAFNLEGLFFL
jgi:hypothetical protein